MESGHVKCAPYWRKDEPLGRRQLCRKQTLLMQEARTLRIDHSDFEAIRT